MDIKYLTTDTSHPVPLFLPDTYERIYETPEPAVDDEGNKVPAEPVLVGFKGEPMLDKKGNHITFHVLSMNSTPAKNADFKHRREAPKADKAIEEMTPDEQQAFLEQLQSYGKRAGAEKLAAMVVQIDGEIVISEKPKRVLNADDKELLTDILNLSKNDAIADHLIFESQKAENYRPKM